MSLVWDTEIGPATKRLVLLALADSANDEGVCWPSVATIARKAKASRRRVEEVLAELHADRIVTRSQRWNDTNIYEINLGPLRLAAQTPREDCAPRENEGIPPAKNSTTPRENPQGNRKENHQVEPTTAPEGAEQQPATPPVQAGSVAEGQGRDGGGQAVNGHQAAQDQQAAGGSRPWGDPGLSVNQVATMLAQDHYDRLGRMGNVAAFVKIMRAGLRAGYTPAMINSAAGYIAAQNWTLTEERLANTLRGGPRRQAPPPPAPPRHTPRVTRPADAAPPSPPTWQGV